ncbi:alpha/beta fold hydrolase [Haloechinothrix alba]|uniref:alpha/beta fold hydrolase n=1 Tax=Haloechinothrix alba TaxID=664784 RepID=UPI001C3E6C17|nr:alpha/beta hydrolase [Haloechinothrix alba]
MAGPAGRLAVAGSADFAEDDLVVLVHPINTSSRVWRAAAARLDRPVLALDLRGHGLSDQRGPFLIHDYMADVLAVLDEFAVRKAHLVGGSLGGTISLALAATHRDRVASVTAFGSTLGTGVGENVIEQMVAQLNSVGCTSYFAELIPQVVGHDYRGTPVVREALDAVGERPESVIAEILRGAFSADIRHLTSAVRCSTFAAAGDQDPTCPVEMSRELATATGGVSRVLPGLGHLPMLEAPELIAELVAEHLDRVRDDTVGVL